MDQWLAPSALPEGLLAPHPRFPEKRVSLGGNWRYFMPEHPESIPDGWEKPDFSDSKWALTPIPGLFPPESGSVCLLRKTFTLSGNPRGEKTVLELSYAPERALVWLNGTLLGITRGVGLRVEFDLSGFVVPGRNTLAVLIACTPLPGIQVPFGILGEVYLYTAPLRRITALRASLDISGQLSVWLSAEKANGLTARIALLEENRIIAHGSCVMEDGCGEITLPFNEIPLWDHGSPALCRVAAVLTENGKVVSSQEIQTGFCRSSLVNEQLLVNSRPGKLFLTNYRPFDPDAGRVLSDEAMEADLKALLAHNFNGICLTAPGPDGLYDLCDRLGMYVLDSACCVSGDTPETVLQSLLRHQQISRENHPCILLPEGDDSFKILRNPLPSAIQEAKTRSFCHISCTAHGEAVVQAIRENVRLAGGCWGQFRGEAEDCLFTDAGSETPFLRRVHHALAPYKFQYDGKTLTILALPMAPEGAVHWSLTRDGMAVAEDMLTADIIPGQPLSIPLETGNYIYKPGRYYLTVEHRTPEGTVTSRQQWHRGDIRHIYDENPGGAIREEGKQILLRSEGSQILITRDSGMPEQIWAGKLPLLATPMTPLFLEHVKKGFHIPDEWELRAAGRKKWHPAVLEVDHLTRTVTGSYHAGSGLMLSCSLYANGSAKAELRLRTGKTAPECIGFRVPLANELTCCRWFGPGPDGVFQEGNPARFVAIHTMPVSGFDGLTRDGVYQLWLENPSGSGLMIRSEEAFCFSLAENDLLLKLPLAEKPKPHTTYTFSFTLVPLE